MFRTFVIFTFVDFPFAPLPSSPSPDDSAVARSPEVLDLNPGRIVVVHIQGFKLFWPGMSSADYYTIHRKDTLKSFGKSRAGSLLH